MLNIFKIFDNNYALIKECTATFGGIMYTIPLLSSFRKLAVDVCGLTSTRSIRDFLPNIQLNLLDTFTGNSVFLNL